ncbi:U3 small nucleolar RNA-associated protein [Acrasis kona]|uniref:U3 small nucleolar RNA-associated protein n=1 Tax=Acrasis kona TaxID=1008807 RepID=A0AAW2Z922_9EUKA
MKRKAEKEYIAKLKKKLKSSEGDRLETTEKKKWTPKKKPFLSVHQVICNQYYEHSGIKRVQFNHDQTMLVVARFSGDMELWLTKGETYHDWYCIKRIPAQKHTTIEAIVWLRNPETGRDTLFTAGLHGYITEWNLDTLCPRNFSDPVGGAIWDMCTPAFDSNVLAIASEDGKIRIFEHVNGDFYLRKYFGPSAADTVSNERGSLTHCKGNRLLTITYSPDQNDIVVGGLTGAYCFNVKSGQLKYKVHMEGAICWKAKYANANILLLGSSNGAVRFCDAEFGTSTFTQEKHDNDVMCIHTTSEGSILTSGVDGKINLYEYYPNQKRYFLVSNKRPSYHDCFALSFHEKTNTVVCGGVDGRLTIIPRASFDNFAKGDRARTKTSDVQDKTYCNVINANGHVMDFSRSSRRLLTWNGESNLHLFKVPEVDPLLKKSIPGIYHNESIPFAKSPRHLLKIKQTSPGGWTISGFCMNESGNMIAVACFDQLMVYVLDDSGKISNKIDCSALVKQHFSQNVCFVGDFLCCVSRNGELLCLIQPSSMTVVQTIDLTIQDTAADAKSNESTLFSNKAVHFIATVSDRYVLVARGNYVIVYQLSKNKLGESNLNKINVLDNTSLNAVTYRIIDLGDDKFCVLSAGNANYVRIYDVKQQKMIGGTRLTHANFTDTPYSIEGGIRSVMSNKLKGDNQYVLCTHKNLFELEIDQNQFNYTGSVSDKKLDSRKFASKLDMINVDGKEAIVMKHVWDEYMLKLPDVSSRDRFGV